MKLSYITLLGLLLLAIRPATAQYNLATTYYAHGDLNMARYQPSELDLGKKRVQVGFNMYAWAGNSSITLRDMYNIFQDSKMGAQEVDDLLANLKSVNTLGAGNDMQLFGFAYQHRTQSGKKYDLTLTVVDKGGFNMTYSDNLMKLMWRGNKQFAGQEVNLGDTRFTAYYNREYAVGTAFPVFGGEEGSELGLRLGIRAKYVQGLAAIAMPKSNATFFTSATGDLIRLNWDYEVNVAGVDFKNPTNAFFQQNGAGLGLDLGASLYVGKNWDFNFSVLDLGTVNYTGNTKSFSRTGTTEYRGAVISSFFGDVNFRDSLNYIFQPVETAGKSFSMPLATKSLLQAEYKIMDIDKKDREYAAHSFYLTYVQGWNNAPGNTTRPMMSLAYNREFGGVFDIGLAAGYGGFTGFTLGSFGALNIGHFWKIGMGSDNIGAIFLGSRATGLDFSLNSSLAF